MERWKRRAEVEVRNEMTQHRAKDLLVASPVSVFTTVADVEECVEPFHQRRHRTPRHLLVLRARQPRTGPTPCGRFRDFLGDAAELSPHSRHSSRYVFSVRSMRRCRTREHIALEGGFIQTKVSVRRKRHHRPEFFQFFRERDALLEEELILNRYLRESPNDSTAVGQPSGGVKRIGFDSRDVERSVLKRIVEIYRRDHVTNGALLFASETTVDPLSLVRSHGHIPRGGYDGQHGIKQGGTTGTTTVL
jgi:hypothetical protein